MFARERAPERARALVMKKRDALSCQPQLEALTPRDSQEQHAENRRLIRVSRLKLSDCSLDTF